MESKIIAKDNNNIIIEWNDGNQFGRLSIKWIHEIQRYVLDGEYISIDNILRIITNIKTPLNDSRLYFKEPDKYVDIMTVSDWVKSVSEGVFSNDDGCGYWMKNGLISRDEIFSTERLDATHVAWYNK